MTLAVMNIRHERPEDIQEIRSIINITLKSSQQKELERQALDKAVADAKFQAEVLVTQFGAKLGKVHSITHNNHATQGIPIRFNADLGEFGKGTFQPGMIKINTEVSVTYQLSD